MESIKCTNCKKELTSDMEIEYSQWLTDYFCHPDCATDFYFNEMQSTPFEVAHMDKSELEECSIKLVKGKLYKMY